MGRGRRMLDLFFSLILTHLNKFNFSIGLIFFWSIFRIENYKIKYFIFNERKLFLFLNCARIRGRF